MKVGAPVGALVRVYRNLHRKCLSVQTKVPGAGWRLAAHVDAITLKRVTFSVSQMGRSRVLATRKKNVHAFVIGTVAPAAPIQGDPVRYNPYEAAYFCTKSGPVFNAPAASLTPNKIIIGEFA